MTLIVVNQQVKQMNSTSLKIMFWALLPLVLLIAAGIYGVELTIGKSFGFLLVYWVGVLFLFRASISQTLDEKIFLAKVKNNHEFEMQEARDLVSRFATNVSRVDSKKRQIQFFIGQVKYTILIKPD